MCSYIENTYLFVVVVVVIEVGLGWRKVGVAKSGCVDLRSG
jgi:hypothetical protein